MRRDGPGDLALVLADPGRVANLRVEEIPPLLGAIEELRAVLWARMVRTPGPAVRDACDLTDELLTVPEVAVELKFTRAYVYEAVRRHELAAVRKGKYVRIRRVDLQAWLEGRRPKGLDQETAGRDSSVHGTQRRRSGDRGSPTSVQSIGSGTGPAGGSPVRNPRR